MQRRLPYTNPFNVQNSPRSKTLKGAFFCVLVLVVAVFALFPMTVTAQWVQRITPANKGWWNEVTLLPIIDTTCPIEWQTQVSNWEDPTSMDLGVAYLAPTSLSSPASGGAIQDSWSPSQPNSNTGIPIGATLSDISLMRTSVPAFVYLQDPSDQAVTEVVLDGLLGNGNSLEGPFVRVGSERLDGLVDAAQSENADFRFQPDPSGAFECYTDLSRCSAFDAVNVYYHIDQFASTFWEDKMNHRPGFQANVKVHASGDGAVAVPNDNLLKFRLGDIFMKNSALANDLIYHEYTHLIAAEFGFSTSPSETEQTRALNEAYADYFAATYTNDPRIGEWAVTCPDRQNCIGPENDYELRTLILDPAVWNWKRGFPSSDLEYGFCLRFHTSDLKCKASYNNFADRYVWGMIWAAALWDLRSRVGPEVTDKLAFGALQRHTLQTEFVGAIRDLIDADISLFQGAYRSEITETFRARGFIVPLNISVEDLPKTPSLRAQVWPIPASELIHVEVEDEAKGYASATVSVFDPLGRLVLKQDVGGKGGGSLSAQLSIGHLKPGMYVLRLEMKEHVQHVLVPVQR